MIMLMAGQETCLTFTRWFGPPWAVGHFVGHFRGSHSGLTWVTSLVSLMLKPFFFSSGVRRGRFEKSSPRALGRPLCAVWDHSFLFVYVWLSMFVFSYVSGPQSIPKIEFSKKNIPLFQQVAPAARGLAWGGWGRSPVVENCVEQFLKETFFLDLFASS